MFRFIFAFLFVLAPVLCFAQAKVAILDFDDRSSEKKPQSKIIEAKLLKIDRKALISHFNAGGDNNLAITLADQIEAGNFDLAVVITSDALRVARLRFAKTLFLFTNVNNPLFLGYSSMEKPGFNSSGVTYYVAIDKQLDFFRTISPKAKRFGFIFDDNALSRQQEFKQSREYCDKNEFGFSVQLIKSPEETVEAAKKLLAEGVDAIILTSSGTVYDNTADIVAEANAKNIPVYSYNKKSVALGAVASLASDYTVMNTQLLPPMMKKVLKGKVNPGTLPVQFIKDPSPTLNNTAAKKLGITIPPKILKKAGTVL
jgi:putative ABC transport system substrate-binding protein